MARTIICASCDKEKTHYAKSMCRYCYDHIRQRRYYREHRDKILAYQRNYYQANKEKVRAYKHLHYRRNRQKYLCKANRWAKENPQRRIAIMARRAARKQALPDNLAPDVINAKFAIAQCFYCGNCIALTLDHFVPLGNPQNNACGTTQANTVLACSYCNASKGTKLPRDFIVQLELC